MSVFSSIDISPSAAIPIEIRTKVERIAQALGVSINVITLQTFPDDFGRSRTACVVIPLDCIEEENYAQAKNTR